MRLVVDVDKNLFEVDIKGSIAYAEILKAAKILTAKDLALVLHSHLKFEIQYGLQQ